MNEAPVRNDLDKQIEEVKQYLREHDKQELSFLQHKEKMAHAGLLVMLGLALALLGTDEWPLKWPPVSWTAIATFVIWGLLYVYTREQLFWLWQSGIYCRAVRSLLRKWVYERPTPADMEPYGGEALCSSVQQGIDRWLWPVSGICTDARSELKNCPKALIEELRKAVIRKGKTEGKAKPRKRAHERIFAVMAFVLLIITEARVLL